MKRAVKRNHIFRVLTVLLASTSLLLAACQGGFHAPLASEIRPPVTADPKTAMDMRQLEYEQSGRGLPPDSELETPIERESFMNDLTEQKPTYSNEEIATDAEDQYQKHLEKQREEKKKREQEQGSQQNQQGSNGKPQSPKSPQPDPGSGNKPAKPPQPVTPSAPQLKAPKTGLGSIDNDFCRSLNVANGTSEADLGGLYNANSALMKSLPAAELKALPSQDLKNRFVCILLPVVIRMEEEVYKQRLYIIRLQAKQVKNMDLPQEDQAWLAGLKSAYRLDPKKATIGDLLNRVDIIPLPLLMAQAALESGWGRSEISQKFNNLFGLHAGSVKERCAPGYNRACVRIFDTIADSVSAYIKLLNSGPYQKFRDARAQMRAQGKSLDSDALLLALAEMYNENPDQYIRDVREIMNKSNKFGQYVFKEDQVDAEKK
jgi:Bax protein